MKQLYTFALLLLLASCSSDDSVPTTFYSGKWNLVSGYDSESGIYGDNTYGSVIWKFNPSTEKLTVKTPSDPSGNALPLSAGTYAYTVVNDSTLAIAGNDYWLYHDQNAANHLGIRRIGSSVSYNLER